MTALVLAFARAWVRLYTRGLPAAVRAVLAGRAAVRRSDALRAGHGPSASA